MLFLQSFTYLEIDSMDIITAHSLIDNNTFGIDAKCDSFIEYQTLEDLIQIVKSGKLSNQKYLHIGGGSNLLFLNDFNGLILHSQIKGIEVIAENETETTLRVGAGVCWDDFVAYCVDKNLYGAENLSYIPGEVGASPVQNVGAYGVEAKDIITRVEVVDAETGECKVIENKDCGFSYRHSNFKDIWKNRYFVHHVIFSLKKDSTLKLDYGNIKGALSQFDVINLKTVRAAIIDIRKNKLPDPKDIGSAGSFFMNPIVKLDVFKKIQERYPNVPFYTVSDDLVKIPAGWMIEKCGWKGKKYKHVGVYEKQALILINCGGGTGEEVKELASLICEDVKKEFGIQISPEVCFIS